MPFYISVSKVIFFADGDYIEAFFNKKSRELPQFFEHTIGDNAFYGCRKLKEVNYKGTEEQWNKIEIGSGNDYLTNAKRNYIK